MAYDEVLTSITLPAASGIASKTGVSGVDTPAGSDHGGKQYLFVKVDSSGNVDIAAATDVPVGVLQNKPQVAGQAATVAISGVSRVVASGTVTAGSPVKLHATNGGVVNVGTLATDLAAGLVVGIALKGGASGSIIPVALRVS
jgi:hypothetical protein